MSCGDGHKWVGLRRKENVKATRPSNGQQGQGGKKEGSDDPSYVLGM